MFLFATQVIMLSANQIDSMGQYMELVSDYFNIKLYVADQREYVREDLAIPLSLQIPLQKIRISYLRLLHNEIAARHGYIFKDKMLDKIFRGTDWYMPTTRDFFDDLNEFESYNIYFIKNTESEILLAGERQIKGWDYYPPSHVPIWNMVKVEPKDLGKLVTTESFQNLSRWEIKTGIWVVEGGELIGKAGEFNAYIMFKEPVPDDGAISFWVKVEHDYGAGILFRYSSKQQKGLHAQYFPEHRYISLYTNYDLKAYLSDINVNHGQIIYNVSLNPNNWYLMQILFDGPQIEVYFAGILTHKIRNARYLQGPFYLCAGKGASARFRDLKIYRNSKFE